MYNIAANNQMIENPYSHRCSQDCIKFIHHNREYPHPQEAWLTQRIACQIASLPQEWYPWAPAPRPMPGGTLRRTRTFLSRGGRQLWILYISCKIPSFFSTTEQAFQDRLEWGLLPLNQATPSTSTNETWHKTCSAWRGTPRKASRPVKRSHQRLLYTTTCIKVCKSV
jgi:hypothetical protein